MATTRAILASIAVLGLGSGCVFDPSGTDGSDRIPDDDSSTELLDCASWDLGPELVDPCALGEVKSPLSLHGEGEYVYDTDTAELFAPGGDMVGLLSGVEIDQGGVGVRAIFVESVEIGPQTTLRAQGSRALALASWNDIHIAGVIDVSSGVLGDGAGANAGCNEVRSLDGAASEPLDKGASGGAGGSLYDRGGDGAIGALDGGTPAGGVAIGQFSSLRPTIHPGCAGGAGGAGPIATDAGAAGSGGGGLVLAARISLTLDGEIHAGGAGGLSGSEWGGGGGGGSGGFVGLVADTVFVSGNVFAHGGGGGGAASHSVPGESGFDARTRGANPASGGIGVDNHAGDGGSGATCLQAALPGYAADDSGGGGGGGLGDVQVIGRTMVQITPGAYVTRHRCL